MIGERDGEKSSSATVTQPSLFVTAVDFSSRGTLSAKHSNTGNQDYKKPTQKMEKLLEMKLNLWEDFTPSTFVFDAAVKWINFCLFIYWVIFVITMGFLYMIKTYFLTLIISTCTSYSQWQYEVCINPFILNYFCYNKKLHIVWLKWLSSKCLMIFHLWYK